MNISIDTYDLSVCVALWGGFVYGVWVPFLMLIVWLFLAEYLGYRGADRLPTSSK